MHRRTIMTLIGGMAAHWSISTLAQAQPLSKVGFVNNGSQRVYTNQFATFRQSLNDAGFIEGQTLSIETRWAEGNDERLQALISELVGHGVSVIAATGGSPTAIAAQATTTTVPIVFVMGADPVKLGLVKSLNKPGGNLTGVSLLSNGLVAKQIAILHEAIAKGATIGFLVKPTNPNADNDTKDAGIASETLGHKLLVGKANTQTEIAPAIADLVQKGIAALVIFPDVLFSSNNLELAALMNNHKLPAIYNFPDFADAGGLLTYGGNQNEAYRQAGIYTGRILKGEKPSDLPVVQSSRFELIVNLKTAKALGMNLSQTLLAAADRVIE
jgi:putative ABC transport system substrate-binding protein